MKLPKIFVILLVWLVIATQANAISLQGLLTSGILGPDAHTHISTRPIRIYAITVTPTASNGYACITQTNSAGLDRDYTTVGAAGYNPGEGYTTGQDAYVKADLQGATANTSYHFTFEDGINVDEQCFVSTINANVQIYYKEQ